MTPAARAMAAISVLDRVLAGEPAERALTNWGRASRYAGSSDRAEVRDLVFQCLRRMRSCAALGGAMTGRGLVLGLIRARGEDPALLFDGSAHGPAPVGAGDAGRAPVGAEALDLPDWLEAPLRDSLGAEFAPIMVRMADRAPVFLRVNLRKASPAQAAADLAAEGIAAEPCEGVAAALQVTGGERKVSASRAYTQGAVELQDLSSQALCEDLPLRDGMRVLDLCAGGGGKSLALAARAKLRSFAHDAHAQRMADLPVRAKRARVQVTLTARPEEAGPFDLVLADVPCSGSGSWRRDPEGKWRLTPEKLAEVTALQDVILDRAAGLVAAGGELAYATCSYLRAENEDRISAFLARHPGWTCRSVRRFSPLTGGDGFFLARLARGCPEAINLQMNSGRG